MIRSRPIRFTANLDVHRALLECLGARCVLDAGAWVVYDVGAGRVALHAVDDPAESGQTDLGFETDDLDALAAAATGLLPPGVSGELRETDHEQAFVVTSTDGVSFTVDAAAPAEHESPETKISIIPMWLTVERDDAIATLEAIGASKRIAGNNGVWTDFRTGDGLVSVHEGEPTGVSLGFEYDGHVDDLHTPLAAAGFKATVIDEAYARTLRLTDPDHADQQIWISERDGDLYGYQKFD